MIGIACDHAAISLKDTIIKYLSDSGREVKDFGAFSSEAVDYPDFALKVAESVGSTIQFGILICGTGIGMSMAANKVKGIRCALCSDTFSAKATRSHNNANILALGERVVGAGLAIDIVEAFLSTPYSEAQRHQKRIDKITAIEDKYFK